MALFNTINFLPSVFQTVTNQRFLGATMDQLITDAVNVPTDGYIGRTFAPTYQLGDNYVPEPNALRKNYQLEASVVVTNKNNNIEFNAGFIDLLNSLYANGGLVNNQQRLFAGDKYNYDGHFDYDKFVNYYNYYWLPNGPLDADGNPTSVSVSAAGTPYSATYKVTRNTALGGYVFSGLGTQPNLPLTLARGGTYQFVVDQPGINFWIQSAAGISGTKQNLSSVSTRSVFGVKNNGTDNGTITFTVPASASQDFYSNMPVVANIDAAVDNLKYTDIHGQTVSAFLANNPLGIDGINNSLSGKKFIFVYEITTDTDWTVNGVTVPAANRNSVWQIAVNSNTGVITLNPIQPIAPLTKVSITSGKTYASVEFWLNNNLQYAKIPNITAAQEFLYYQDSLNPNFAGVIKLVDNASAVIDVNLEIIGKAGYVSPNGVLFTNGLKIQFDTTVTPSTYAGNQYYVDGVGTSMSLVPVSQLVAPTSLGTFGIDTSEVADYITINRASQDRNPWSASNHWFHKDVIEATAKYNNEQVTIASYGPNISGRRPIIEFESNLQLFNYGKQAGNKITYITFEATDAFANIEGKTSYVLDGNLLKNGDRIVFANDYDITIINEIWQVQIQQVSPGIQYLTLVETFDDPVEPGQSFLVTGGLHAGKIYQYNGTWSLVPCQIKYTLNQPPLFDLVDTNGYSFSDATVYPGSTFSGTQFFGYNVPMVSAGSFVTGATYTITSVGTTDFTLLGASANHYGITFTATGPGTGTGMACSVSLADTLLGFPLTYQNFNNIGDIQFSNFYDTDTFTYTENQSTVTVNCNTGYLSKNSGLSAVAKLNNWTNSTEVTEQFQAFTNFFNGNTLPVNGVETAYVPIDVLPVTQATIPHIKVYQNNTLLMGPGNSTNPQDYQIGQFGIYYAITLTTLPAVGDKIDVKIFSDTASTLGYYEAPDNLDFNALNENFNTITLGQLRTHYDKLIENTAIGTTTTPPLQDSYLKQQGGTILKHDAPLVYAMTFLADPTVNFFNGISLARKEYNKFKNKFLNLCTTLNTLDYSNPATGVDKILQNINGIKNSTFPWYYSDMVPQGSAYSTITYTVVNARQTQYEISSIFNNTVLSNRSVLIYVNGLQKIVGIDYTFSLVSPSVTFTNTFTVGDVIVIREYNNTDGNYIPETPSKLGLHPSTPPQIYVDNTYQTPTTVIQGHDGSLTPAFGDFRDQFLLELELRIYNNIKASYKNNQLDISTVIPGRFRTTDYSLAEYNQVLSQHFLNWVGSNKVDYTSNTYYDANNSWTWNYSEFPDVVDGSYLQGFWRAIYKYWYDTDTPNLTPWEMLGFSSQPTWWTKRYGPAPYTSGNMLLWEDLEAGYVWNNGTPYTNTHYARPGLTTLNTRGFVPVDSAGNLLSPTQIPVFKQYNNSTAGSNFSVGHQGPVETAWRRSSDYPFALQNALALLYPAKYFSTQLDTSRFYSNPATAQFTNSSNQAISPKLLTVNGATTNGVVERTSGYINWVADGIKNLGMDPVALITEYFTNLSVQLNYKVGGFIDQKLITVSAEQTTPGSTNASVIIPDTNYKVYLSKSVPVATLVYSAVIIELTESGYSVKGYDTNNPFFNIIPSLATNNTVPVTVNEVTVQLYQDKTNTVQTVPYGTTFTSIQQTADFLYSYERYLVNQGLVFNVFNPDLNIEQNWTLSIKEFMYWAQQGWSSGNIIVLNPVSTKLELNFVGAVIDEITNTSNGNRILDENFNPIKNNFFNIIRTDGSKGNRSLISTTNNATIAYARLNLVQYEHVLVFDNVDAFGDIIYIPNQGTRQFRLKLNGTKTGAWNGALSAPGYIYSNPNLKAWYTGVDYKLGDIVTYNNGYYTASKDIPAANTFSLVLWTPISKADIQTGLLSNFALNAQEFVNFYDVDNPSQNKIYQKYASGLIGFRQRKYLTDLGVSLPTQTKFYQGFIKQKGTNNAITALTKANFNNIQGNLNVYEEWAFRSGVYGGVTSNQFTEFVLDQSVFNTNPVAFTVGTTYSTANTIVDFTLANVYNASNLYSTSTSIYTNRTNTSYIHDLPSVGYMNLHDIDYTIFDISNINPATENITNLGAGSKIWVAKNFNGVWDIFRATETNLTATNLSYVLDNYAQLTFNNAHGFNTGDVFILKYFNSSYDGIYTINNVPTSTTVIITISDTTTGTALNALSPLKNLMRISHINGSGTVYRLKSARVNSVTDLVNLQIPPNGWLNNDHVWVDNATVNGWGTYTYNKTWQSNSSIRVNANSAVANDYFGHVAKISTDTNTVYVGSPGTRQVQLFSNTNGSYTASATLSNVDSSFGTSIESQGDLLVVGAPISSNVHVYLGTTHVQMLHSSNALELFGSSISMSVDQHWLYIGAPGSGTVKAYWTADVGANANYSYVTSVGTATGNFGQTIKTNADGSVLFVGAPATNTTKTQNGNVYIYTRTANSFTLSQTLTSRYQNAYANFGSSLAIDGTADNLFIGIPGSTAAGYTNGQVERYIKSGSAYVFNSTINHPFGDIGTFGSAIGVSSDANILAVGSVGSPSQETTTFDKATMTVDLTTTSFIDRIFNSGATYLFQLLSDYMTGNNGQYLYTQELENQLYSGEQYGATVDVTRGLIAIGAPGYSNNQGTAYILTNRNQTLNWSQTRGQMPTVDIDSVNRTFIYNKTNNNIITTLDYTDPAKGKVLNAVDRDINYKLTTDPALYNGGSSAMIENLYWGPEQVGIIWWDLSTARYINYEQDTLSYRLTNWGKIFPGSSINVYQWVESTVPPSQYVTSGGIGVPLHSDNSAYSTYGYVNPANGVLTVKYYFWVKDLTLTANGKNNSVYAIAESIKNPQSQGIPYATILRDDSVALYNVDTLLVSTNSVIQLGSQNPGETKQINLVHSEYALVQEGNPSSHVPKTILTKLIDSLAGVDQIGNVVPDPALIPSQAYGIGVRPRQSMMINQSLALSNYLSLVNPLLLAYPVVERKVLTILNSSQTAPNPESGAYQLAVDTLAELSYVDTATLGAGYAALVKNDSTQLGKWSIYTLVTAGGQFPTTPTLVQSYKTNLYWSYADWYDSSYDPTSTPNTIVANKLEYGKLTLTANTYIKVLDDGSGNFIVYYIDNNLNQSLVGIQNGTIQINTTTIPALELRQILLAMQENIFVDDLAVEYNKIFFAMIKYILTEQKNLDWVFKTSFLSITQSIRKLGQFPSYVPDNQNFYLDYIDEVKPYRTKIREFVADYIGNDTYGSDITDFDLAPYWDTNLNIYRGPNGEQSYDSVLQQTGENSQWTNNHKYQVVGAIIENPGTGYIIPPQVVISGGGGTGAKGYAVLNDQGGVAEIRITDPGSGFTATANIQLNGGTNTASAYAVLRNVYDSSNNGHNLVRSISTTMRFDRISYTASNNFVFWDNVAAGQYIAANTKISLNEFLYNVTTPVIIDANVTFPVANVTTITAGSFNNAADRISAFNKNAELGLYIGGIEYPGVTVDGNTYSSNVYDATIQSFYGNVLGVDPNNIVVDGGAYYDTYNSHAPEEMIPGRLFDSLNISVYTGINGNTNTVGYRITHGMNTDPTTGYVLNPLTKFDANATLVGGNGWDYYALGRYGNVNYQNWPQYYAIFAGNTSTLSSDLRQTDKYIHVTNATAFANPNPELAIPGVVYINGEKIVFYKNYSLETVTPWAANLALPAGSLVSYGNLTNIQLTTGNVQSNVYLTTGNVFARYFANITANLTLIDVNSLGQVRRGVDGTATPLVQSAGSQVVESDIMQLIPGGNAVHLTSWIDAQVALEANITDQNGNYISTDPSGTVILNTGLTVGLPAPALEYSITPQAQFIKGQR